MNNMVVPYIKMEEIRRLNHQIMFAEDQVDRLLYENVKKMVLEIREEKLSCILENVRKKMGNGR